MAKARKLQFQTDHSPQDCVALDVAFLNRNTFGDVALRTEIIGLFLSQLDGALKSIALPLDSKAWHYLTHTMKGAASAVGAQDIAALAENWENMSPPATQAGRAHCEAQLRQALAAFKTAVDGLDA